MTQRSYTAVGDVMSTKVHTIDGLATVRQAIDRMREYRISSLVIDRRHDGDEYGILVIADIAEKVLAVDHSPDRTNVYEIMSKPVLTLDSEMDIKYAARMLSCFRLSRALVTREGRMVGIVTLRDLVLRQLNDEG